MDSKLRRKILGIPLEALFECRFIDNNGIRKITFEGSKSKPLLTLNADEYEAKLDRYEKSLEKRNDSN